MLDKIMTATEQRVKAQKKEKSLEELKHAAARSEKSDFRFEKALAGKDVSFICELKKASPSKGLISADFPYMQIAEEYEEAGAAAVSVLTEPSYFLGSDEYLQNVRNKLSIPILRKDFIFDEYQIYQAKVMRADAVLLIVSICRENLRGMINLCNSLGLSALVETHNEEEVNSALDAGARIIGVNNRDLRTFNTDVSHCLSLRNLVPSDCIFVAESGIKSRKDIEFLMKHDINAVLIGEMLMSSPDRKAALRSLRGGING